MKLNLPESSRVFDRKPRFSLAAYLVGQVMASKSPIMVMPYTRVGYYTNVREHIARKGYPIYTMKIGDQIVFFRTDVDIPEVKMPSIDEVEQGDEDEVIVEEQADVEYASDEVPEQVFEEAGDIVDEISVEDIVAPVITKAKPVKQVKQASTPIRLSDLAKKDVLKTPTKAPAKSVPAKKTGKATVKGKAVSKVASPSITPASDAIGA